MHVLIVDDNASNRELLREQLEADSIHVIEAADGVEALDLLGRHQIDVIISDVLMPRMDGYRLCSAVREDARFRQLPIIIYSATYASAEDARLSLDLGADLFLRKPAKASEIVRALRNVVRAPRPQRKSVAATEDAGLMRAYNERLVAKLESKNAELADRNARLQLQAVAMESAANGIVIALPDGTIEWVNPAFTKLTGYSLKEVVGNKPNLLRSGKHDQQFYRKMWDTILAGQPWHGEVINKRKDGSLYIDEMTITPVPDASGRITHFVAIKQDVTPRKATEEREARIREELEDLVRQRTASLRATIEELEHFSYSITHDMRAPLRAMNTYAALLEQNHGQDLSPEALRFVSRIQFAATRLDNLIRDSLKFSETLQTSVTMNAVDVGPLVRGIIDTYPNLHSAEAEISIDFESLVVRGNEAALTQCFSNLLGNAVKFVAPGVKPRIRVTAEEKHDPPAKPVVRISVHDNGIGIPACSQQKIFGMFNRLHGANEYPGTGIGLALVHKMIQRMGGTVGVCSASGEGSVFWLELEKFTSDAISSHTPG